MCGMVCGEADLKLLALAPPIGAILREAKNGAPDRIRTYDLCLRRAALYPAELRVRGRSGPYKENSPALQSNGS